LMKYLILIEHFSKVFPCYLIVNSKYLDNVYIA